jgi:hypothetical protein
MIVVYVAFIILLDLLYQLVLSMLVLLVSLLTSFHACIILAAGTLLEQTASGVVQTLEDADFDGVYFEVGVEVDEPFIVHIDLVYLLNLHASNKYIIRIQSPHRCQNGIIHYEVRIDSICFGYNNNLFL